MSNDWNIDVSLRLRRLPPYLFAVLNRRKYDKRRTGVDIIDLGMGNPSDPPPPQVVEKLCQAARDQRTHGYSQSIGLPNLRKEVAILYDKKYVWSLIPKTR